MNILLWLKYARSQEILSEGMDNDPYTPKSPKGTGDPHQTQDNTANRIKINLILWKHKKYNETE